MNRRAQTGGSVTGWFKHRCGAVAFFVPYAAHVRPSHADNRWCYLCQMEDHDWKQLPGHQILTPEEHWEQAVEDAGRAMYEASPVAIHAPAWEHLSDSRKAGYRKVAEQVITGSRTAIRSAAVSEVFKLMLDAGYHDLVMYLYDNLPETPDS